MVKIDSKKMWESILGDCYTENGDFYNNLSKLIRDALYNQGLVYDGEGIVPIGHSNQNPPQAFKAGDWIVSPNGVCWHIDKIEDGRYYVFCETGECADWPISSESLYHQWTIQDAKDGDVLVDKYDNIAIFVGIENRVCWISCIYCGQDGTLIYPGDDGICGCHLQIGTVPATKEQRDQLFKAIHDAGYEWDADTKQLKRIEPESFEIKKGCWYMCIKDEPVNHYTKGKLYQSQSDCSLPNDLGEPELVWDSIFDDDSLNLTEYFRPATPEEVLEAKHGITGINSKNAEGKLGEMISQRMTSAKAKEAGYDKPELCKGCNNVKGCIACVDGSNWAHIEEPELSQSEVTKESVQLTEFEKAVEYLMGQVQCGILVNLTVTTKEQSKKLLSMARKQIAGEIDVDDIVDKWNGLNKILSPEGWYRLGVMDVKNLIEKGE